MPKKILLADDSITIQKVVELTFSDGDYEVTAVNNGAKAVQKLSEMRPDIILSDIIMPEKNGYEVCEYVKSHPEFRTIPVVLLTGTFEPFDPDRAEKAGCDAVVTKPFESQSLIHKVEELIAQSQAGNSPAAAPVASVAEAASPWMDETAVTAAPTPFTHDADIFSAAAPQATTEMPFEIPSTPAESSSSPFGDEPAADSFGGETRAFPRMTFDEMQQLVSPPESTPEPTPVPEPSPWDEPAQFSGETRAFEKMSFDDFASAAPIAPVAVPEPESESPFGAPPPPEEFSSETRAFTRMSIEEMQQLAASQSLPAEEAAPEPSAWDEQPPAFGGGETRAFPKMNFDDYQQEPAAPEVPIETTVESSWEPQAFSSAPEPESPFGEDAATPPAFGGETRAFPKMNFDDFRQINTAPEPEPEPEPQTESPFSSAEPEPEPEPLWAPTPVPAIETYVESYATAAVAPFVPHEEEEPAAPEAPTGYSDQPLSEDMPFAAEPEPEPEPEPVAAEPSWAPLTAVAPEPEPEPEPAQPEVEEPAAAAPPDLAPEAPALPIAARSEGTADLTPADLTDEQIDRIARRVVELMSEQVVRNIAWEVIPDLAEMVVKERIRQLEAEA
ncbi:MAG TPA: response regulator [Thermoanaerobaculia bacterium]|jgi:CheY-like chemotaxis protein|nr:response regulator [Thermoanaerobaculia bacterium]